MKECTRCRRTLSLERFGLKKSRAKNGGEPRPVSRCKECVAEDARERRRQAPEEHREAARDYFAANREEMNEKRRKYRVLWQYGITHEMYEAMLRRQAGVCAICGGQCFRSLAVDHDHATGRVRGLLCANCNNGLGRFKDRPDLLLKAAAYLQDAKGRDFSFGSGCVNR